MSKHDKALENQEAADVGWLVRSVTRMVRPVVRLCVGRMSCNAFINVVKRIYVEEANQFLKRESPDKKVTKSALALLTGLDSRAVNSIMQERNEALTGGDILPEMAIIDVWANDETFLDRHTGNPRILPIYGRGLTFQTLVSRTAGRNVTCPTVLEKLTANNHVRLIDDTHVELLDRFYSAATATEKVIFEAGSFAIGRLAGTVGHNLNEHGEGNKWLQQERWSIRIPRERVEYIRNEVRALVEEQIRGAERVLEKHEDPVKTNAHCSAGLGWFYWESNPD